MTGVMKGIRILEVAEHTFVPAASAVLSDWGADVVKVEHALRGDAMRGLGRTGVVDLSKGVAKELKGKAALAGLDLAPPVEGMTYTQAGIEDAAVVAKAVQGMDAVVHIAARPNIWSGSGSEIIHTNVTSVLHLTAALLPTPDGGKVCGILACYSGAEAVAMGLANVCVPPEQLDATVQEWAETICERSPTAIAIAKRSFNMDTAHQAGIAGMGLYALKLYYETDESKEGVRAFNEKRAPDFRKHAR